MYYFNLDLQNRKQESNILMPCSSRSKNPVHWANPCVGEYQVELPDGRLQIVTYHADHENGYVGKNREPVSYIQYMRLGAGGGYQPTVYDK